MRLLLAPAVAMLLSSSASAIIIRDDIADSRYRDLGEAYRPMIVQLAIRNSRGDPGLTMGMGTLITPEWVLTAAHVAQWIPGAPGGKRPAAPHHVFVNSEGYLIDRVVIPNLRIAMDGAPFTRNDIALVKLARPVAAAKTACLYRGREEKSYPMILAGMGETGSGAVGVTGPDGVLRGAVQRIDGTDFKGFDKVLWYKFERPTDPDVHELEGIAGPGDSGGPGFIHVDGQVCVAGVGSGQDSRGGPEGLYGVVEYYTRVSSFMPWIDSVIGTSPEKR